jgi:hypothetical protein
VGGRRQQPEILLQAEHRGEADACEPVPASDGESEMRTKQTPFSLLKNQSLSIVYE